MYKTEKAAQAEGRRVRKMLGTQIKIKNVKLEVFENMGWHWWLKHRHFGIYPAYSKGHYFCLMGPNGYGTERRSWTEVGMTVKGPHKLLKLIKSTLRIAKREVEELQDCIDEIEALERK